MSLSSLSSTSSPSVQVTRLTAQRTLRGALGHFATGIQSAGLVAG
jgi:hypothetical protein